MSVPKVISVSSCTRNNHNDGLRRDRVRINNARSTNGAVRYADSAARCLFGGGGMLKSSFISSPTSEVHGSMGIPVYTNCII